MRANSTIDRRSILISSGINLSEIKFCDRVELSFWFLEKNDVTYICGYRVLENSIHMGRVC